MRRSRMWSHWSGGVIATIVAVAFCAGIGMTVADAARSRPSSQVKSPTAVPRVDPVPAGRVASAALAAAVTFAPKPGAVDVPLDAAVVVNAAAGQLTAVRVVTAANVPLSGTLDPSWRRWRSHGPLAPGTTYTVTAVVSGSSGVTARSTATFRTLTPVGKVEATVFPDEGLVVGVAQPIVIRFDHFVGSAVARAAALKHFTVIESRPVLGGWHWFSTNELHFRPKALWPVGEKVTVVADLRGWNAGNGIWGDGRLRAHFTVGHAHVSIANLVTDQMTVSDNGKLVATYAFSGGRPTYPTMNGFHVVLDREGVIRMVSSSNGIPVNSPDGYDELVYADVHISDSGEYVHAAPWSVASQGHTNVSHGCINLSPTDAFAFFAFSRVGDVVAVVGGPRPPELGDHGVMDWDTNWKEWTPVAMPRTEARSKPPTSTIRRVAS